MLRCVLLCHEVSLFTNVYVVYARLYHALRLPGIKLNGDAQEEKEEIKKEELESRNDNVEYVSEQLDVGPALEAFSDVFARFQFSPDSTTVRLLPLLPSLP